MVLVTPTLFSEAQDKLGQKVVVGAGLDTEGWRRVPLALRERAFWSATIENVRFLQRSKDLLADWQAKATEEVTGPTGRTETALKVGSRAEFISQAREFALAEGMGPIDEKDRGTIKDITSARRLGLIFDVQTQSANDFGAWKQGQNPDVLDEFPAQRFIREADVEHPRPLHQQNEGVVRLKTDLAFWIGMNSPEIGGFGVPWGPWGFNSGMGVEDVDRASAESFGLLSPGAEVRPVDLDFNAHLKASVRNLAPDIQDYLKESFSDQITIADGSAWWTGSSATSAPPPPPSGEPAAEPPLATALVSDGITIEVTDKATKAAVTRALKLIDGVHDDGVLPKITVDSNASARSLGTYFFSGAKAKRIGVKKGGARKEMTLLHEVGHFLDHQALDIAGQFASTTSGVLDEWFDAVKNSAAYKAISDKAGRRSKSYLLMKEELWARSYTQWVITKSGDKRLLKQLDKTRTGAMEHFHWSDADFVAISKAIDALFTQKGWI